MAQKISHGVADCDIEQFGNNKTWAYEFALVQGRGDCVDEYVKLHYNAADRLANVARVLEMREWETPSDSLKYQLSFNESHGGIDTYDKFVGSNLPFDSWKIYNNIAVEARIDLLIGAFKTVGAAKFESLLKIYSDGDYFIGAKNGSQHYDKLLYIMFEQREFQSLERLVQLVDTSYVTSLVKFLSAHSDTTFGRLSFKLLSQTRRNHLKAISGQFADDLSRLVEFGSAEVTMVKFVLQQQQESSEHQFLDFDSLLRLAVNSDNVVLVKLLMQSEYTVDAGTYADVLGHGLRAATLELVAQQVNVGSVDDEAVFDFVLVVREVSKCMFSDKSHTNVAKCFATVSSALKKVTTIKDGDLMLDVNGDAFSKLLTRLTLKHVQLVSELATDQAGMATTQDVTSDFLLQAVTSMQYLALKLNDVPMFVRALSTNYKLQTLFETVPPVAKLLNASVFTVDVRFQKLTQVYFNNQPLYDHNIYPHDRVFADLLYSGEESLHSLVSQYKVSP